MVIFASPFSLKPMEPGRPRLSQEEADMLLLDAAEEGSLEDIKKALDAKAKVNITNKWGEDPLLIATQKGHIEIVRELLKRGAYVNGANAWGTTALHYAASYDQLEIVSELINNGAHVNAVTERKFTPLYWAACHDNLEVIRELIAQGADVNRVNNDGTTTLYRAARWNHREIVRELLIYGARAALSQPRKQDVLKRMLVRFLTDLEYAVAFSTLDELIQLIDQRRARSSPLIAEELQSALALAVGQGRVEIVTFLISNYNLPQPVLFDALRIIRAIFTRFELLQRAEQDDEARTRCAQELQPYQAIYALLAGQLYHVNSPPVTFLDRVPLEIFTLLLWFVIDTRLQK
jgi:ankyrin repeat protein